MRRWLLRCLRCATLGLLALAAAVGLYVGTACALMFWPVDAKEPAPDATATAVEAWVLSNGVHTDYVLPIRSAAIDWSLPFAFAHFPAVPADAEFVAIGWGDREFYLHTPTWADLTASRAFGALLGRNHALLHVSYLRRSQLLHNRGAYLLPLSQPQYARLAAYVRAALPAGRAVPVPGAHYGSNDAFYEAEGSYDLFETCNTWSGRGLRRAGVTASRWTPFDFNVVRHLQRAP